VRYGETYGFLSLRNLLLGCTPDVVREWKNLSSNANLSNESACAALSRMRTIVSYGETFGLLSLRNLLLGCTPDVREWKNLSSECRMEQRVCVCCLFSYEDNRELW